MKKFAFFIAAVLLVLVGTPVACAHTVLISSTPAQGSKFHSLPTKISLKFADQLLILGKKTINRVVVIDPRSVVITPGHDVVKGAVLTHSIVDASPLIGIYKVIYRVSAQDGHVVTGIFFFTLQR